MKSCKNSEEYECCVVVIVLGAKTDEGLWFHDGAYGRKPQPQSPPLPVKGSLVEGDVTNQSLSQFQSVLTVLL